MYFSQDEALNLKDELIVNVYIYNAPYKCS